MHRRVARPFLAVLALTAISVAVVSSADIDRATSWTKDAAQSERLARVEAGLPALDVGGRPRSMDIAQWMSLYDVPGLSVAVFDGFELVWAKTYGVTAAGTSDPVTLGTLFQAGSISKPVTAMAAMHFVERGTLALDADINDALRSWKLPENDFTKTEKVTLRRLLSHSAGTTVHGFPGYAMGEPVPTLVQVLDGVKPANTAPVRVDLAPGSRFRYSGGGTSIVQLALVDRLGKPFPEIMDETVMRPLGLTESTYEQPLPAARAARAATGHRSNGRLIEGRWHIYPEMAAAGLWTTPRDLAAIAIEMAKSAAGRSNRVVSQATSRLMLRPQAEEAGLGFFVDATGKTDRFGHNGADEGFQALLVAFAATGRGVAVMVNSDNGIAMAQPLVDAVAREYQWPGYTPWVPGVAATLTAVKKASGVDAMLDEYRRMKRIRPVGDFDPSQLNRLGYECLRSDANAAAAIAVFALNVEMFPKDANAYDSLAEAYMEAGRTELAVANYRRSLELDPGNDNAVAMLKKMGVEWKRPR